MLPEVHRILLVIVAPCAGGAPSWSKPGRIFAHYSPGARRFLLSRPEDLSTRRMFDRETGLYEIGPLCYTEFYSERADILFKKA